MFAWAKAVISRFASANELQRIGQGEYEQIARDLNLSSPELDALSRTDGPSGELLRRRLADFSLSAEGVRKRYPEVFRDLERVCGNCTSVKRCAREFQAADSAAARSKYCPNTPTLQALESESKPEVSVVLPIGPCCC